MISTAMMTKRSGFLLMAMGLLAGLVMATMFGGGSTANAGSHTGFEEVRTNGVEQNFTTGTSREKTMVWFYGSGFTPGENSTILVTDGNGVLTDITIPAGKQKDGGGTVYPLVANEHGAWATMWTIGRFTRKGVGSEGIFTVLIVDDNFKTVATAPLALCNNVDRPAITAGVAGVEAAAAVAAVDAVAAVAAVEAVAAVAAADAVAAVAAVAGVDAVAAVAAVEAVAAADAVAAVTAVEEVPGDVPSFCAN